MINLLQNKIKHDLKYKNLVQKAPWNHESSHLFRIHVKFLITYIIGWLLNMIESIIARNNISKKSYQQKVWAIWFFTHYLSSSYCVPDRCQVLFKRSSSASHNCLRKSQMMPLRLRQVKSPPRSELVEWYSWGMNTIEMQCFPESVKIRLYRLW